MDTKTTIAGIELDSPCYNAAGPRCVTKEELHALGKSSSAAILSKSMTLEPRQGNPEPRYHDFGRNSINSMGLPNLGYQEYDAFFSELRQYGKPIFASVSGLSLEDNKTIISTISKCDGVDLIELNLSCPNLPGKPQMGYDFEQAKDVLSEIGKLCEKPWGVKLPPYFDETHFKWVADILNGSKARFVTCINSPGNGLVIDPEKEQVTIKPKGGLGGIGGPGIKPFGLSNVRMFRKLLNKDIDVVGVGGIISGMDIFEYILAGADAVQVGTALMQEGTPVFDRLDKELQEVMEEKGYSKLADFRNKLKEL